MEQLTISMFTNTVKYSGDAIFVKPFCDFFNINYNNQIDKISSSQLLKTSSGKSSSKLLFGDERERITLSKQGFITWILQLNPSIVREELRENLIQYQTSIFDFLFGSIQRREIAQVNYKRLAKLKRLRTRIASEIAKCEADVQGYLKDSFMQGRLEFKES